ncbi:apoptosis-inducing factor 3 isoform X2 [Nilaparvata lugens]|uniref:apoptosis-inducing factor 3 isoform X2 n=1 Tax=Nilaparvata lugens TaxID=108931 RepID=UPI00193D9F88|nr:apoptosis-inducing factor 3 isoform X2 [Nilaparvata lugens]
MFSILYHLNQLYSYYSEGTVNCQGPKENVIEEVVCQSSDIRENEMKVFEFGKEGDQILLVKQEGRLYALGNKCTHYGAPLVNGALGKGRVRCPWHGACFSLETGDIEDFPGLDCLPKFGVEVVPGGGVKVTANKQLLKSNKRARTVCAARAPKGFTAESVFVIIGAGAAGNNCAETLRQLGFPGRVVMVSKENYYPYDRIKLSKAFNVDIKQIQLRPKEFYKEKDIEVLKDKYAVKVMSDDHVVILNDTSKLNYSKLFIATGARGRVIKMPGSNLNNIFTIRNIDDAKTIASILRSNLHIVVCGSSFIGMETAAFCVSKVKSVTVVGTSAVPFENILGRAVGERITALFKEKGVHFVMKTSVKAYNGDSDNNVASVTLANDQELKADLCVLGIGSEFNTEFLKGGEVLMNMDGSVPVDKFLETNVKGIFAGGDIAFAPVMVSNDKQMSIGHWQLAHYHGYIAAHNMLGTPMPLKSVPFFWTVLFGLSFRYAGVGGKFDDVVIVGDVANLKFVAYYCEGDNVNAVLTVGSDPVAAKFAERLTNGKKLKKSQVTGKKIEWVDERLY